MTRTVTAEGGDHFLFASEIRANRGLYGLLRIKVIETSRWRLTGTRVEPLEYLYRQSGPKQRESSVRFDWQRNVIGIVHKKASTELQAEAGMLDKLLYQLVLMRDLEAGSETLAYTVIDGNKIRHYPIERLGEETVNTPLGNLDTVKLRYRKAGSERSTTLWCARALHYLPVKLDHRENEDEQTSALIESVSDLTADR